MNLATVFRHPKTYLIVIAAAVCAALVWWLFAQKHSKRTPPLLTYYIWNNQNFLDSLEHNYLITRHTAPLRIKILEIGWNDYSQKAVVDNFIGEPNVPSLSSSYFTSHDYIPEVFILNQVFEKIDSTGAEKLAQLVHRALQIHNMNLIVKKNDYVSNWDKLFFTLQPSGIPNDSLDAAYKKLVQHQIATEIDCDWTEKTSARYFIFLKALKKLQQHPIHSTLRLHQYKYRKKNGIPPVDKVTLMCYNMGELKNIKEVNSIFQLSTLKAYIEDQEKYPVNIDLALPAFSWYALFRNGKFNRLIPSKAVEDSYYWESIKSGTKDSTKRVYTIKDRTYISWNQPPLEEGDVLRYEDISSETLIEAYDYLMTTPLSESQTILFFDLSNFLLLENHEKLESHIRL